MTKKEKSKFNPFAQVLEPDEEILWLYASSWSWDEDSKGWRSRAVRIGMMLGAAFLSLSGVYFLIHGFSLTHSARAYITVVVMSVVGVYGLVMLPPLLLLWAMPRPVYAVTNKRIMRVIAGKVDCLDLNEVNLLYMSSYEDGHVFFSPAFPEWRHIPHPEEVIKIIQQAKRTRRLEIAHEDNHEDEHDEEREEQIQSLRTGASSR